MDTLNYQVVDFDNHYYEPADAFTRHGDEDVRRYVRWVSEGKKRHIVFGHAMPTAIPNPTFNPIGKPGAFHEHLKELAASGENRNADIMLERHGELEPLRDEYHQRDTRLLVMDEQGVERTVMFPTLGVGIDGLTSDDVEMTYKVFGAFNRWLDEDWGFAHGGRIYAAPFIPVLDPRLACRELDVARERGARVVALRPGPAGGRSPADPVWDPFWARIQEAGMVAAYHSCTEPDEYQKAFASMWQRHGQGDEAYERNLFTAMRFYRPIHDTALALVLGNVFGRFPNLRVASVENGSAWVELCLHELDHVVGFRGRHIEAFGVTVDDQPSEVFKRNFRVAPFPEDDMAHLVELIGSERVLFGSDWPHLEGTPAPLEFADQLEGLDDTSVRMIMRDNALALLT
jgi:predicted TIM-barrel fold metal-dependent hydrolase